jgi:hypothetical protein
VDHGAIAALADRILQRVPHLREGAIALVDSPRWPVDLDCSSAGVVRRRGDGGDEYAGGRQIDRRLRALVKQLLEQGAGPPLRPLALFPTPRMEYFARHGRHPALKPHLRAFARELFGGALEEYGGAPAGGTFTRFMIAGFATYRALERIGVRAYETYPDLQMRLWSDSPQLPPKSGRKAAAVAARRAINHGVAARLGITGAEKIRTLDEADAAIVALSAAAARRDGANLIVEISAEGVFMTALNAAHAARLNLEALD